MALFSSRLWFTMPIRAHAKGLFTASDSTCHRNKRDGDEQNGLHTHHSTNKKIKGAVRQH